MIKRIFKRKSNEPQKEKPKFKEDDSPGPPQDNLEPKFEEYDCDEETDQYQGLIDEEPIPIRTPIPPKKPIPKPPRKDPVTGRIIVKKDALVDLPVQNVISSRTEDRDFGDEEYGYSDYSDGKLPKRKEDVEEEEKFLDAHSFTPCHKDAERPMVSRYFFLSQGNFKNFSSDELIQEIDATEKSVDHQTDVLKYITSVFIPYSKQNGNILDIFTLLQSRNRSVRNLCIFELFDTLLHLNPSKISTEYARSLMEKGIIITFSVISETKKSSVIFPSLIQMGVTLVCFLYLKAVSEVYKWTASLEKVRGEIEEKYKRVLRRKDPDVQVFVEMTMCLFNLDDVDIDDSCLMGVDLSNFIHPFTREESSVFIEGFVKLYHTCNLIVHAPSKFKSGVQDLVKMSAFMSGCEDLEKVKVFQRLFAAFTIEILNQDKWEVKLEVLSESEDKLLSVLLSEEFLLNTSTISECLLFHPLERIREKYTSLTTTLKLKPEKSSFREQIENILKKCAFRFESSENSNELLFDREQCTFCDTEGSVTCIYEFNEDVSTDLYDNTTFVERVSRSQKLGKELEILKSLESNDISKHVTRLLAFYQFLPNFYIKERLPGDNLQRRLLDIRDKGRKVPIRELINVIIQAVEAVIYVHGCGILVRDITTASFGCTKTEDGFFIKLKTFEMAADSSQFGNGGIVDGLTDMDFNGVPTRWAAPESLLEGHYSIYSDVWSVNILTDEILNYAAWPYSEVTDADVDSLITNVVFTHLKPQGFNRPRRIQGLLLEGLASEPEQRLKLEALKERMVEISNSFTDSTSDNDYETYAGSVGGKVKVVYDVPPLTKHQIKSKSVFERGIPKSMKKYRSLYEDPYSVFAQEIADYKQQLGAQKGITISEISSVDNYMIESEDFTGKLRIRERVSEEFLQYTYQRLREIDAKKMSIEPWPPRKIENSDGTKSLQYKLPRSTSLLEMALLKERGESMVAYIELLYELALHVDSFHSAGWIFRCLRAKHVWIRETQSHKQMIVVAKVGSYRLIASGDKGMHFEQLKVEEEVEKDAIQWLPIESIKAQLYSKESDVYAFGMVTWEVMTAYGQKGVVYHGDEERELDCIPFNYQDSNNLLQHLIEGYIPEKPLQCPDWLYREITRPCLFHQKIGRPSMKRIAQILSLKLNKSPPPLPPKLDSEEYEDCYEDPDTINDDIDDGVQISSSKPLPTIPPKPRDITERKSYINVTPKQSDSSKQRPLPPPKPSNITEQGIGLKEKSDPDHGDQNSPYEIYDDCLYVREEETPVPLPIMNIPQKALANKYERPTNLDKGKTNQRKKPPIPIQKTPLNMQTTDTSKMQNETKVKDPPIILPKPNVGRPTSRVLAIPGKQKTSTAIEEKTNKVQQQMADVAIFPSSEKNHNLAQAQCVKPKVQHIYINEESEKESDKPPAIPPRKPTKN